MSFKEHLRKVIITYPSLFPSAIHAYDHIFLAVGNNYKWENGELIYNDESSLCSTTEEAINAILEYSLNSITDYYECYGLTNESSMVKDIYIKRLKEEISIILNVENLTDDLSVPEKYSEFEGGDSKFTFYTLSKYSLLANIPDDVHYGWINVIKDFVDILDRNRDKFEDSENLFENIKTRVNILFKRRIKEFVDILP